MNTKKNKYNKESIKLLEELIEEKLNFSNFLKAIREGEGLSQEDFASILGISRQYVCDIEKGRRGVGPKKAESMAEILGYSKEQFVRLSLQDLLEREGIHYLIEVKAA